jgi:hypothetical protein
MLLREQRAPPLHPKVRIPDGPFMYSNHCWNGLESIAFL